MTNDNDNDDGYGDDDDDGGDDDEDAGKAYVASSSTMSFVAEGRLSMSQ